MRTHGQSLAVVLWLTATACGNPPAVEMREKYSDAASGVASFDHSNFDALLARHVKSGGFVDYTGLATDAAKLDSYLQSLGQADFEPLTRDAKLAFLINAYNAFTLRLILDHPQVGSIRDIPSAQRWDAKRWKLAGATVSLNDIEHERIRPHFAEARIHFALVCAAVGCPPLRSEAYTAANLDAQLADQTRFVHGGARWLTFDKDSGALGLTKLYDWYGGDFEQSAGSVPLFVARHATAVRTHLDAKKELDIDWLDYDWSLNSTKNAR